MARYLLLGFLILTALITNAQQTFENCTNGIDDDGDGLIDCADAECSFASQCSIESANFNCSDGIDNDGDGNVDCADSDCNCNSVEICGNGIDDDHDGQTDCEDGDCSAACETNCTNGIDDDNDGFIDYFDGDCVATPRQRDSLALVSLYHATNGDNWTRNDNWLTGLLDTWYGIQLQGDVVISIGLWNNNLRGSLPIEINNLRNISYFDLIETLYIVFQGIYFLILQAYRMEILVIID